MLYLPVVAKPPYWHRGRSHRYLPVSFRPRFNLSRWLNDSTERSIPLKKVPFLTVFKRRGARHATLGHTEKHQSQSGGRRNIGESVAQTFIVVFIYSPEGIGKGGRQV